MYWYVQLSMSVADPGVEEREYRPFRYIRDAYPRYLFTLDSPCSNGATASAT